MTVEIWRVNSDGKEVKNRTLLAGQVIRGFGHFAGGKIEEFVEVGALERGEGIIVRQRDKLHEITDTSKTDHYFAGEGYYTLIIRKANQKPTVFHTYPQ